MNTQHQATEYTLKTEWHYMGRWTQPLFLISSLTRAYLNPSLCGVIPFAPEAYTNINHRQFVKKESFVNDVQRTKNLLLTHPTDIAQRLIETIRKHTSEFDAFSPTVLTAETVQTLSHMVGRQGRQWYEIMLIDGALMEIYPTLLPEQFELNGEMFSPATLLATVGLPKRIFPMIEERTHLLQIAEALHSGVPCEALLDDHYARFSWMGSMCWWEEPTTREEYRRRAQAITDPKIEMMEMETERTKKYARAKGVLAHLYLAYPQAWQYIDIIRDLTDLREENWDAASLAGVRMRPLWKELAKSIVFHTINCSNAPLKK